jgi:hypothetical protein
MYVVVLGGAYVRVCVLDTVTSLSLSHCLCLEPETSTGFPLPHK